MNNHISAGVNFATTSEEFHLSSTTLQGTQRVTQLVSQLLLYRPLSARATHIIQGYTMYIRFIKIQGLRTPANPQTLDYSVLFLLARMLTLLQRLTF